MTRMTMGCVAALVCGVCATLVLAAPRRHAEPAQPSQTTAEGKPLILSDASYWRWHMTWRKAIVAAATTAPAPSPAQSPAGDVLLKTENDHSDMQTPPPPADWVSPDFNDSSWPRQHAPFDFHEYQCGVYSIRGKFNVTDPTLVKSPHLMLVYYGGAVVYLNGKEIARGDMPAGAITADTPGNPYPDEAWLDSKRQPLPPKYNLDLRVRAGEKDLLDRVASRQRKISVDLPPALLRQGVNVLCIETHRTIYNPCAQQWPKLLDKADRWVPNQILSVQLTAEGSGIAANIARPPGIQVWNDDVHEAIEPDSWGDPNEVLRPIHLIAARNGTFSGSVAVSSDQPLKNVVASSGALAGPGGAKIDAAQVEVRYLRPGIRQHPYSQPELFDALMDKPDETIVAQAGLTGHPPAWNPARGNPAVIVPVWVTVHVPAAAAAGDYTGTLTLQADGLKPVAVPIEVHVIDYDLPNPRDWKIYVGIYQSPTTLAMQYGVPEWSDKHWALVERSLKLLAPLGDRLVNIPLVEKTQFGNEQGMIHWLKQEDGSYKYDLSIMDRYLDAAIKLQGKPQFVALHLWHAGGWGTRKLDQPNTVTVIDKDGKAESMQVPVFGSPESTKFWTPVLMEIKAHLAKLDLDKNICLGIISDGDPPPELVAQFAKILPGVGWFRGGHVPPRGPLPQKLRGGGETVLWEQLYGLWEINDAKKDPLRIWNESNRSMGFLRMDFVFYPPLTFRTEPERALFGGSCGIGRECLDFWPLVQGKEYKDIYNRWPESSCAQREPTITFLSEPGADGAVPSARYEMLREGLQESEALLDAAEAADPHSPMAGKISPDLAQRCKEAVWENYTTACEIASRAEDASLDYYGWQARAEDLFTVAGEIAAIKK